MKNTGLYPVNLSKAELWALWQAAEASIPTREERNKAERTGIDKLARAYERARQAEMKMKGASK